MSAFRSTETAARNVVESAFVVAEIKETAE
jgi:hypothetical protein